jgi:hypothetical protein
MIKRRRRWILKGVLGLWLGAAGTGAWAADPGDAMRFDIPAQPLAQALPAFSTATGLQMMYDATLVPGRRSTPVSGAMSPRSALVLLLKDTGLSARFTSAGAVVIYASTTSAVTLNPLTAVAAPVVGRDAVDPVFLTYAEVVRRRITEALRIDAGLTDKGYRIGLRLWVGDDGRPMRAEILSGSGEAERDGRFLDLAKATTFPAPPPRLPQPLRIEFAVRPGN